MNIFAASKPLGLQWGGQRVGLNACRQPVYDNLNYLGGVPYSMSMSTYRSTPTEIGKESSFVTVRVNIASVVANTEPVRLLDMATECSPAY